MIELKLKFDTVVEMQNFLSGTTHAAQVAESPAPKKKAAKKKAEPAPAAVEAPVATLVPTAPVAVPTPTTAPADVPALPTAPAEIVPDLRGPIAERLKAAADAGHRDAIIGLLGEFGKQRFSEVQEDVLESFSKRLTDVIGA